MFVALFDPPTSKLSYVNAGHNYPVLARAGGIVSHLDRGGLLLGVDPDAKYEEAHVELAEDDRVLLFTDGACEALNENEEEFGEDRIAELFAACKDRDLDRCLDKIEDEVVRFSGSSDFADDFTLLVVRRNGS